MQTPSLVCASCGAHYTTNDPDNAGICSPCWSRTLRATWADPTREVDFVCLLTIDLANKGATI